MFSQNQSKSNGSTFIYVNSADRIAQNQPTSNFQIRFDDINSTSEKNLSIQNIIIPRSYYAINNSNSTFLVNALPVALTPGNYTSATFTAELKSKLDALAIGVFTVVYNITTGKLLIDIDVGSFSITSNNYNYKWLGLPKSTAKASTGVSWVSPNVIDIGGTLFIDLLTDIPISSVNTRDFNRNILARIYVNADFGGTIQYTHESFDFVKLLTSRINGATFILVDENNVELDMNGLNWSAVLEVV